MISIAVIGGSGFWANVGHYKHILQARESQSVVVKIVAIVDPNDPYAQSPDIKPYLREVLNSDSPRWIRPGGFDTEVSIINSLKDDLKIDMVIIASSPTTHYPYALACVKHRIHAICDKPIVSHANASFDSKSAALITEEFKNLCFQYEKSLNEEPRLLCCSVLRRRGLKVFRDVASELLEVYQETGAGINNMSVIVNSGKYLYPAELNIVGAHGYREGIGSLSHSAYHYIDLISWYIGAARGNIAFLQPKLNYVFRVKDYISSKSYMSLWKINSEADDALRVDELPKEILESELNTSYTINLMDNNKNNIGSILFNFNQVSYTPRTLPYSATNDPADLPGGGRTSSFIIDIHQDGLLNYYVYKNDTVFEEYSIESRIRKHTHITQGYNDPGVSSVDDPYNQGATLVDAYCDLFQYISDSHKGLTNPIVRSILSERLATELYGAFYELLSKHTTNKLIKV
jgi:hypothetical protein